MVDVPTRTLLDYLNSLPSGGVGGAVTRDLTIRDDLATGQQAVPPGGSTGEVLVKLGDGDFDTGWTPAGQGTVQTITVDTANGFAGASDGDPSNPALTISTTVTGILEGDGTSISAATVTGTGELVLADSPALITPDLGTPSAATLTNATGLPISTGVSGLGVGVATFLATPSSANLAAAVTDETGSGALVFATSPALVTPSIGAATGTSLALTGALSTSGGALTVSGTGTSTIAGPLNIAGASAGQVVFPATQNASSNANTLDDYEEGVWTPVVVATGSTFNVASSVGTYTKVGNLVNINFRYQLATTGNTLSSNVATITGLPFPNDFGAAMRVPVIWLNTQTAFVGLGLNLPSPGPIALVSITGASTTWGNANADAVFSATAGTVIYGSFTYKTTT